MKITIHHNTGKLNLQLRHVFADANIIDIVKDELRKTKREWLWNDIKSTINKIEYDYRKT